MALKTIDGCPPGNVLPITMLGQTWATCVAPRAKPQQEGQWVLRLPGIVAVVDMYRHIHDARACENVAELVRLYRAAGVYDRGGQFRLAWWYGSGTERIALLEKIFFGLAAQQLKAIARGVELDELLHRLRRTVETVEARLAHAE